MALSTTDKHSIIYLLGYPGKTLLENSTHYSRILADRLESLNGPVESQVKIILGRVKILDEKIDAASSRFIAKKVGDIEINQDEMVLLRKERRTQLRELSSLLDIQIIQNGSMNVGVML